MRIAKWLLMAAPALLVTACNHKSTELSADVPKRTVFFDKSGMDTTVKPGDNFFEYANGNWMKKTVIPPSESGWGSFYTLDDDNVKHLHQILEDVSSKDNTAGSTEQKVGDLYKSGMDTVTIEKRGYDPIKPQLAKIAAVKDYKGLVALAADGFKTGDGSLFNFYVSPDDRISTKNAAHFDQGGLNLPEKSYYTDTAKEKVKIRNAYVKYVAKMF